MNNHTLKINQFWGEIKQKWDGDGWKWMGNKKFWFSDWKCFDFGVYFQKEVEKKFSAEKKEVRTKEKREKHRVLGVFIPLECE